MANAFPLTGTVFILDRLERMFFVIPRTELREANYDDRNVAFRLKFRQEPFMIVAGEGFSKGMFFSIVGGHGDVFWEYDDVNDRWVKDGEVVARDGDEDEDEDEDKDGDEL